MRNLFSRNDLPLDIVNSSRESEFLRCLAPAYRNVYASVLAIIGDRDDADDVVQEVCVVLWQKYDQFEAGTNFKRWACTIAFNVAKAYSRKQRKLLGRGWGDEALMKIAQVQSGGTELFELQRETLRNCVERLREGDRKLLLECYRNPNSQAKRARVEGHSIGTVYSKLKRIRHQLTACVRRTLGKED